MQKTIVKRIMITAAGGPAGFCLAKYLYGRAYLIGLDSSTDSPAQFFCDELYQVPFADAPDYKEIMLKIIGSTKPDIIVPTFDEDLLFFDKVKKQINSFILLSPGSTLEACNDKRITADIFPDIAAKTYTIDEIQQKSSYPLYIKPARGRGSKIGFKAENDTDLRYALLKVYEPFIQEWLPGPEVTVDTFADLKGKLLGTAARIREQTRGGISTKGWFIKDSWLEETCRIVHKRLKIIGAANIQCMKDSNGNWKLIEINPRYSGGIGLSYKASFDSITPLVTINIKQKTLRADKMTPRYGIKVIRYWEEKVSAND
jgi:carbamoyl-phosphate synthase large subunit